MNESQLRKGIKLPHKKHTGALQTVRMDIPDIVEISMSQHIGAPCKPLVQIGGEVKVGQPIGDSEAFVCAPIHSGVSGKVVGIQSVRSVSGGMDELVVIETDGKQEVWDGIKAPEISDHETFVSAVRAGGIVGLGGAAFPTHVKYNPPAPESVQTLIINGAECEPFITSDHRAMLEDTEDIIDGALLIMKYLALKEGFIGIESNKPDAIDRIQEIINRRNLSELKVSVLGARYPQGAERVLVREITGKTMGAGVLPAQLGVILSNVATVAAVARYCKTGMPLVEKRITVDGSAVKEPKNIIAPVGTSIADIIDFCGGYVAPPEKILMGGPMMGRAIFSDRLPLLKNNNAILAFSGKDALVREETACINCGRCYKACPFALIPTSLAKAYENEDLAGLQRLQVNECMECGSCAYVCPAGRPLGFINKMGKALLKEAIN